eukprot:GILJ01005142.1.p1 GENE.GILJ01005142.1~~GILJ01005142.1.p1  ORF type:complete len:633 (-),score=137.25 GILJ01005142.1:214-2112(-)
MSFNNARRSTLGGVTASNANSRASLGPSRVSNKPMERQPSLGRTSIGGGRQSIGGARLSMGVGRQSMGPGRPSTSGPSRRSSAYGAKNTSGKLADPRPLTDKGFQNACMKHLIRFLAVHDYDHSISLKVLTQPTAKEFFNILQFLLRMIDPHFTLGPNPQEEIPVVLKRLNYPFTLNKSVFASVGAPTSWPHLLGVLSWLAELLTYDEEVLRVNNSSSFDDKGLQDSKMLFDYLSKAYGRWLAGDDSFTLVEDDLAMQFEARNQAVESEIDQLRDQQRALKREIEHLKSNASSLGGLREKKQILQSDLEKFSNLMVSLKKHKQGLEKKLNEKQTDVETKERELLSLQHEKVMLTRQRDSQELTPEDVERMRQEKHMLEESLREVTAKKEEVQKSVWEIEMKLAKKAEDMERAVRAYNNGAEKLHLIPLGAKNSEGVDYELSLNLQAARPEQILRNDFKSLIKPALRKLKDGFVDKIRGIHGEVMALQEELDRAEELRSDKQSQLSELENRLKKFESLYRTEQEAMAASLQEKRDEAEAIEQEVQQMKLSGGKNLSKSQATLVALKSEFEQLQKRLEMERQTARDIIAMDIDLLANHKGGVQEIFDQLLAKLTQVKKLTAEETPVVMPAPAVI